MKYFFIRSANYLWLPIAVTLVALLGPQASAFAQSAVNQTNATHVGCGSASLMSTLAIGWLPGVFVAGALAQLVRTHGTDIGSFVVHHAWQSIAVAGVIVGFAGLASTMGSALPGSPAITC